MRDDARDLLRRINVVHRRIDALSSRRAPATRAKVCQVYNAGAIPSAGGLFYAAHPVVLSGATAEGGTASATVGTSLQMIVYPIHGAITGDYLIVSGVDHRWASGKESVTTCGPGKQKIRTLVVDCGGIALPGATVSVTGPGGFSATCTTASSGALYGFCDVDVSSAGPGTYTATSLGASNTVIVGSACTYYFNRLCTGGARRICVVPIDGCAGARYAGVTVQFQQGGYTTTAVSSGPQGTACVCLPTASDVSVSIPSPPTGYDPLPPQTFSIGSVNSTDISPCITYDPYQLKPLTVAAGYRCGSDTCCPQDSPYAPPTDQNPWPVLTYPTTLFVNDGIGIVTVTYSAVLSGINGVPTYVGTAVRTAHSGWPSTGAPCNPGKNVPVPLLFTLSCQGQGMWLLIISCYGCLDTTGGVLNCVYMGPDPWGLMLGMQGMPGAYTGNECPPWNGTLDAVANGTASSCPPALAGSGNFTILAATGGMYYPLLQIYGPGPTVPWSFSQ